jgi:hypothetical protein
LKGNSQDASVQHSAGYGQRSHTSDWYIKRNWQEAEEVSNTKKVEVEVQAKVEIKKVGSSLNIDLNLSLLRLLRLTPVSRFTSNVSRLLLETQEG